MAKYSKYTTYLDSEQIEWVKKEAERIKKEAGRKRGLTEAEVIRYIINVAKEKGLNAEDFTKKKKP